MNSIDVLRFSLTMSRELAAKMFDDVRASHMTQPTIRGGNHPLWIAGHLAWAEADMYTLVTGQPNPMAAWTRLFEGGSEPMTDPSTYPTYDEVVARFLEMRDAIIQSLDRMTEADLDAPSPEFGTIGGALAATAMHDMLHLGQVADTRRVLGRKAFFDGPPAQNAM